MKHSKLMYLKAALSARWLAKRWSKDDSLMRAEELPKTQLIICTGERMSSIIDKLYRKVGVGVTTFLPEHSKGLSNEFRCFANFDCAYWKRV